MSFFRSTLSLFVLSSVLVAQQPPVPVPQSPPIPGLTNPQPANPEQEGLPSPLDVTAPLVKPNPNARVQGEINFRSLDGISIAALYQRFTGKRVLVSSAAAAATIAFIQTPGLTNREAADLLEQTLLIEGFQINPSPRDPDVVFLLGPQQPGGNAQVVSPVRVVDNPAQLAIETGLVTYVMNFQFIKPEEAQRAFTQIYGGQFRPGGTIAEVTNASSLIITEKAALIQSLLKLKEKIDVPSATVGNEWIDVRYADVQELSTQLNEIFNAPANNQQTARVQRQGNRQAQAAANTPPIPGLNVDGATPNGGGGEEQPPSIIPDTRTNRILLIGRPSDLAFIKDLIQRWDVPSDQRNFLRRKLKYLPVYEFLSVAQNAIERTLGPDAQGGQGGANPARSSGNLNQGQRGGQQQGGQQGGQGGANGFGGGGASGTAASLPGIESSYRPRKCPYRPHSLGN